MANYQNGRCWINNLPKLKTEYINFDLKRPIRWQKLKWLSEKSGFEFISDYHSTYGYKMDDNEMQLPLKRTVGEELNELSVLHDLSWKKSGKDLYLVKNNRWYRDDYMEVPSEYLRQLTKTELPNTIGIEEDSNLKPDRNLNPKRGSSTIPISMIISKKMRLWLDRAADIASNLSPWQIGKGLKYYVPNDSKELTDSLKMLEQRQVNFAAQITENSTGFRFEEGLFTKDSAYVLSRYRTILFYSTLKKDARTKLLGDGLPFEELNADQRERAIWLLPRLGIMLKQGDESPKVLILRPLQNTDSFIPGKLVLKEALNNN